MSIDYCNPYRNEIESDESSDMEIIKAEIIGSFVVGASITRAIHTAFNHPSVPVSHTDFMNWVGGIEALAAEAEKEHDEYWN